MATKPASSNEETHWAGRRAGRPPTGGATDHIEVAKKQYAKRKAHAFLSIKPTALFGGFSILDTNLPILRSTSDVQEVHSLWHNLPCFVLEKISSQNHSSHLVRRLSAQSIERSGRPLIIEFCRDPI